MASQDVEPIYRTPFPSSTRLFFACKLYIIKFVVKCVFGVFNFPGIKNKNHNPTSTKVYPVQPSLRHRIFVPKSYKSGDPFLPLYLDIHGGGFVLFDPSLDDEFCANFCNENKVLVVSLDYPLAPAHQYPKPVYALIDVVKAVLEDESLPFDKKKVVIGGGSAGANLALAIAQDPSLQGKFGALVAFYPPCDFTTPVKTAISNRPKHAPKDPMADMAEMFDCAYFADNQDLRDPQLSPRWADRAKLPPKIYIVGCDFDMLCYDAEKMAESFASVGDGGRTGTDDCWEQNGVKWERCLGEEHAFDLNPGFGETKTRRIKRRKELYANVAEFLFRHVYV